MIFCSLAKGQSWKSWFLCQQNQHVYAAAYYPHSVTRTISHRLAIEYVKLLILGAYCNNSRHCMVKW